MKTTSKLTRWFAKNLGVNAVRKEQVYLDLARSLTLTDINYWLQVLFAAGIATLGLVLNSPAVIIGAMLISPLMGSILASGLALATGDIILAIRAIVNLSLSCGLAIALAFLVVLILPAKEMTSEIMARTQPNLLDLVIALFSGAVGAVAICKEAKGVVTSVPGVSIAVALMPPLCVVGYGIGTALTFNAETGFTVALGGGLLFFTNLVAITFMAMLVFLALNIDANPVREGVRAWQTTDRESIWVQSLLDKMPAFGRLQRIGGLPSRLLLIVMVILAISVPLSRSYDRLRSEINYKQQQNRFQSVATEIWQKNFAEYPGGKTRSYISQLSLSERERDLATQLQVVTSQIYTEAERSRYKQLLAAKLQRPSDTIALNLIQIPTAAGDLFQKFSQATQPAPPPTTAQLQSSLLANVKLTIESLRLPSPARLVSYAATTSPVAPLQMQIVYLSEREIDRDGQAVLVEDIRSQLDYPTAEVRFDRLAPVAATVTFESNAAQIPPSQTKILDPIGRVVQENPTLQIELQSGQTPSENETLAQDRSLAIQSYLQTRWQIPLDRYPVKTETATTPTVRVNIATALAAGTFKNP
ncbi:DUF389 domain-containing protein [Chamaesiphon sp. OTE_20_metabat_361]|uniref:DUF389 domain-containing protein n=1 Tax=Chamaesiphon sp. OTE_20_metabat_361 TaxID=2964689 RepID=UPI00286D64FA|nr:DUF389 domain-containing protein [Chamaesiphon sp. OTE_20_metabat_361]